MEMFTMLGQMTGDNETSYDKIPDKSLSYFMTGVKQLMQQYGMDSKSVDNMNLATIFRQLQPYINKDGIWHLFNTRLQQLGFTKSMLDMIKQRVIEEGGDLAAKTGINADMIFSTLNGLQGIGLTPSLIYEFVKQLNFSQIQKMLKRDDLIALFKSYYTTGSISPSVLSRLL